MGSLGIRKTPGIDRVRGQGDPVGRNTTPAEIIGVVRSDCNRHIDVPIDPAQKHTPRRRPPPAGLIQESGVAAEENRSAPFEVSQHLQVRVRIPGENQHGSGVPGFNGGIQGGIAQPAEMIGSGPLRDIGDEFKLVTLQKRDIPGDGTPEARVGHRGAGGLRPGIENPWSQLFRARQCLKYGRVILDGMRQYDGEPESFHAWETRNA